MEQFSLCVMQKNNCMDNSATIPTSPDPQPAVQFRGAPLTFEAAEVSHSPLKRNVLHQLLCIMLLCAMRFAC
jgi:hypothetical protein